MVGSTRQIECADRFEISGSSRSYGRYQEASRGNVIPSTRKNRGSSSSAPPSLAISSLLLGPGRFSAYHIGRFRSVAGRLIWPASSPYGDTDRSRQLIKRFPAYCRARLDSPLLLWAYPFHRRERSLRSSRASSASSSFHNRRPPTIYSTISSRR